MRERMKSFASFRPEGPRGRSANAMTRIVKKTLSDVRLGAKQERQLRKLAQRPDSEIDFSDIPELTEKSWRNAVRNPFYRPVKKQLTLRLDADVIAWLRRRGRVNQPRANAFRRAAMLKDERKKASKEWAGKAPPDRQKRPKK